MEQLVPVLMLVGIFLGLAYGFSEDRPPSRNRNWRKDN